MGFLPDELPSTGSIDDQMFGSIPDIQPVKLMRVHKVRGQWLFRDEVEVEHQRTSRSEIWRLPDGSERTTRWWQESFRTPSKSRVLSANYELIAARWPWTQFQCDVARFRSGSKKEKARRPSLENHFFESEDQMFAWLASLPHDFWETGDWLTARIDRPTPRQFSDDLRRDPRSKDHPRLVLGVAECPANDIVAELLQHAVCQQLLALVEQDKLIFWFRRASLGTLPKLGEDTKAAAQILLTHAVRMSLAGPESESPNWCGRRVLELTDPIFRTLLNCINRRENYRTQREQPLFGDQYSESDSANGEEQGDERIADDSAIF
jgi:hypothetical protein